LDESFSNFPRHALFVPIMLKAATLSNLINPPQIIGSKDEFVLNNYQPGGENIFHLKNAALKFDIIPEVKIQDSKPVISVHDQVRQSGNYELYAGASGKLLSVISFNYDRRESDLAAYSEDELRSAAEKSGMQAVTVISGDKQLTRQVAMLAEGKRLWKYCVWLVLLFIAAEVVLIRFLK
jgi:hypothetical protein